MPESDPLEERLAALSTGPVPPLAGADEVRRRGGQRRRRRQGALVCAAVLVAASLGGTAALLSGGGGQDALRTAQAPTGETPCTDEQSALPHRYNYGKYCGPGGLPSDSVPVTCDQRLDDRLAAAEDPEVVSDGSYEVRGYGANICISPWPEVPPSTSPMTCAEWLAERSKMVEARGPTCVDRGSPPRPPLSDEPGADTTLATTPSVDGDPTWDLATGFLSPEQAGQIEQPGWSVDDSHQPAPGPLLDPCATGVFPGDPVDSVERAMGSEREVGGSRLVQEVLRYSDEPQAAAAFDVFAASVEQCPQAPAVEGEGVTRFEVVGQGGVDGSRTLLVQVQPCGTENMCTAHFRSYLMLAQDGDGLTQVFYGLSEDGDPFDAAKDVLDAVAAQLVRTVRG